MSASTSWAVDRVEDIERPDASRAVVLIPGVESRPLVGADNGARGLFTGLVTLAPGASIPYHERPVAEAVVLLEGDGGRRRRGPPLSPRPARRRLDPAAPAAAAGEPRGRPRRRAPRRDRRGRARAELGQRPVHPGRAAARFPRTRRVRARRPPRRGARHRTRPARPLPGPLQRRARHPGPLRRLRPLRARRAAALPPPPVRRVDHHRPAGPPPASSRAGATSWPASPPRWSPRAAATTSST